MPNNCDPACTETKIVFTVDYKMNTTQPQGNIFDPRNIHIAIKLPRSGAMTYYKLNEPITDHQVIFSVLTTVPNSTWTEGVPEGFTAHDCDGDDGKPGGIAVITRN